MSLFTYFVLVNRSLLDSQVRPIISDIIAGHTDRALQVLREQLPYIASDLDASLRVFFQESMQVAIEAVDGLSVENPVSATGKYCIDVSRESSSDLERFVKGGLALSLCLERPNSNDPSIIPFWLRQAALIRKASPTADRASNWDDPLLIEPADVGIFQTPEVFLRSECVARIGDEVLALVSDPSMSEEREETILALHQFLALMSATAINPSLAVLRGYV